MISILQAKYNPHVMPGTPNPIQKSHERRFNPARQLDLSYPPLAPDQAICVGLDIDWRQADALRAFALRHTHSEEHARAARFLRAEDGLRHLLGRTLLRSLAIHYGGMAPDQPMPLNAWGKPEPVAHRVSCNATHSGNQIWAALTFLPMLGIDVESAIAPTDYREIMRSFHPLEIAELQATPDARTAMMRCWARKEAVAKAVGMGLSLPLDTFAVGCGVSQTQWLRIPPSDMRHADWTTIDLPLRDGYVGALAIAARCSRTIVLSLMCDTSL